MEFTQVVRGRRMVRRFDPQRPVPRETVAELVALGVRAPSAGFSQGWDFVALTEADERERFWNAAARPGPPDAWLRGVSAAPALIVCCSNPSAYLDRYAEPDKGWTDRSLHHWPVPYWDTDTAMAAMIMLLAAQDRGLAALFFGIPEPAYDAVAGALGLPPTHRMVGVLALGHELVRTTGSAATRARRPVEDVLHYGRYGVSTPPSDLTL